MNSDQIKQRVKALQKKYGTNDPFEIAREMGILVCFEPLGTLNGYYCQKFRIKQIHINENLPEIVQRYACAHELGHATMHPNSNTPFLTQNTYLSVNKLEIEANKFAMELLIPDNVLYEYIDYYKYTTEQIGRILGYHKELIELRLK